MHSLFTAVAAAALLSAASAFAGVAPNSGADRMTQSGAKIAKKPTPDQQTQQQQPSDEGKPEKK